MGNRISSSLVALIVCILVPLLAVGQPRPGDSIRQGTSPWVVGFNGTPQPVQLNAQQTPVPVQLNAQQTPIPVSMNLTSSTPIPVIKILVTPSFAEATYVYTSITASYTTALSNSADLISCKINNQTNVDIKYSLDGGTTGTLLNSSNFDWLNFSQEGRKVTGNISVKHTGSAPSSGNVYITCWK